MIIMLSWLKDPLSLFSKKDSWIAHDGDRIFHIAFDQKHPGAYHAMVRPRRYHDPHDSKYGHVDIEGAHASLEHARAACERHH
jgi:hypothetical protein